MPCYKSMSLITWDLKYPHLFNNDWSNVSVTKDLFDLINRINNLQKDNYLLNDKTYVLLGSRLTTYTV